MVVSSLELIEVSPLITARAGQSPEGKMPALGHLRCSHHAKDKQSGQSEQHLLHKLQRAQLSRWPTEVSKTAERLDRVVSSSKEALIRAQFSPASVLAFAFHTAMVPCQHH